MPCTRLRQYVSYVLTVLSCTISSDGTRGTTNEHSLSPWLRNIHKEGKCVRGPTLSVFQSLKPWATLCTLDGRSMVKRVLFWKVTNFELAHCCFWDKMPAEWRGSRHTRWQHTRTSGLANSNPTENTVQDSTASSITRYTEHMYSEILLLYYLSKRYTIKAVQQRCTDMSWVIDKITISAETYTLVQVYIECKPIHVKCRPSIFLLKSFNIT